MPIAFCRSMRALRADTFRHSLGVAHEPRDGWIRVEFAVDPRSAPRVPFQHGLPGTMEVRIERVAPATLVLRTIGKRLTAPGSSSENVRQGETTKAVLP